MEFRKYISLWTWAKQNQPGKWSGGDHFYEYILSPGRLDTFKGSRVDRISVRRRATAEHIHWMTGRPYYNVWPCVLEMADRMKESTPVVPPRIDLLLEQLGSGELGCSIPVLELRYPKASYRDAGNGEVNALSILMALDGSTEKLGPGGVRASVHMQDDRVTGVSNALGSVDMCIDIPAGVEISNVTADIAGQYSEEARGVSQFVVRMVSLLGLLQDKSLGFLERDVCSKDRGKEPTEAILRRATARKGFGFDLGRILEQVPHTRRPHWAVRWMVPQSGDDSLARNDRGLVPKLRPIKGAVVMRERIAKVPTGFEPE